MSNHSKTNFDIVCPIPLNDYPEVTMAHGGGGKLMHNLISGMMLKVFSNPALDLQHDGALLDVQGNRIAFTTDSHVVSPLFYPGGDIGSLSVFGTANDLAMCGAKPLWLSAGFIIEEGFPMKDLWQIVQSMGNAAEEAGVSIVTGDTKVVDRGKGDGLYINTAGVGVILPNTDISPLRVQPGDAVILSGDIGRHGIAIMAVREGMKFESVIESDLAPLSSLTEALFDAGIDVHCMRDLTRGGLASAMNELATSSETTVHLTEAHIPVEENIKGACEILGYDPLFVANEGRFTAIVPAESAERTVEILKQFPAGGNACIIGNIIGNTGIPVKMTSVIGAERIVDMLSGEQLPRIC